MGFKRTATTSEDHIGLGHHFNLSLVLPLRVCASSFPYQEVLPGTKETQISGWSLYAPKLPSYSNKQLLILADSLLSFQYYFDFPHL